MAKTTNSNNATINNTNEKENTIMTKKERIQDVARRIEQFTKTSDEGYVTKEEMAELIFDCMGGAKPNTKKYKRAHLIETIMIMAGKNNEAVQDNTSAQNNNDAKAKTDELFRLIKTYAIENKARGYGYTVSAYMLCAYILQSGHGIKKLKGHEHEITPEQKESVKSVRKWLIDKGYITPCTYKTSENISVYTDEYDGLDNHKAKMVHISKSANLTCVGVSSYKVNW